MIRWFLAFFACVIAVGGFGADVILKGNGVTAIFSERNGALLSLCGADGTNRVLPAEEMFVLSFLDAEGNDISMNSSEFEFLRNGRHFTYTRKEGPSVDFDVRIEDGSLKIRPTVSRWPKGLTLNWIDAPQVYASTEGRLYWPMFEGCEISDFSIRDERNSWVGYEPVGWVRRRKCGGGIYPASVQMQFLAHYREGKGLYFAAEDPQHTQKGVEWEHVASTVVRLSLQTFCGDAKNGVYASAFDYILRPYDGDWMAACEFYRDWVRQQPAFRKPTVWPEWAEDSPVTLIYPIKGEGLDNTQGMGPNRYYPYVNAMPDVRKYATAFRSRVMPMLMHWEGTAPWCPPYVWPPFGGESKLAEFRDALHAEGHLLGVYCSGTAWTQTSSIDPAYSRVDQFEREGLVRHMMRGPKGEIDASICNGVDAQRLGYDMCISEDWCRRTVKDEVSKIAAFGIDYCQLFDQNPGGGSFFCWSKCHSHPPVPGSWQTRASISLQNELVDLLHKQGSKMTIGCEAAAATPFVKNLFFNDSRAFFPQMFGRPVPGVPFVFHEWMCNFSGNQCGVQFDPYLRWTYSFHCGDMMSVILGPNGNLVSAWGVPWSDPLPDQEKLIGLVRGFNALRKRYPDFLLRGRMVRPFVEIVCDEIDVSGAKTPMRYPKILSSFWENASGKRIGFLSNWREERVRLTLRRTNFSEEEITLGPLETLVLGGARYVIVEPRDWQGESVRDTMDAGKAMFAGVGADYKIVKDDQLALPVFEGAHVVFISDSHKLSPVAEARLANVKKRGGGVYKCWRWCFHDFDRLGGWLLKEFPGEKEYWEDIKARNIAMRESEINHVKAIPPKKGEIRRISFHNQDWKPVVAGRTVSWDEGIAALKKAGFNQATSGNVAPNLVRYNSKVLPVSKYVAERGDTVDEFVAACRKHGVKSVACLRCFMSQDTDEPTPEFDKWMKVDGRACVSKDGTPHKTWLCPSHPLNRKLVVDVCEELADKGFDVISLDYIRLPDPVSCWCDRCRKEIAAMGGDDLRHRQETIHSLVREIRMRLKATHPKTELAASVYMDPKGYSARIGQAWDRWCAEGLLDTVEPMNYVEDPAEFAALIAKQKPAAGKAALVPLFGPSLWADDLHDERHAAEMIRVTRDLGCAGFGWFTYDERAHKILETLSLGPLKADPVEDERIGFKVEAARANAHYRCGEDAVLKVTATNGYGEVARQGSLDWKLDNFTDDGVIASGTWNLADENPRTFHGTLDKPDFLRLLIKGDIVQDANGWTPKQFWWGVAFEPENIMPGGPCPEDFDVFWKSAIDRLEREVPLDPRIVHVPGRSTSDYEFYRISFATVGGKRVYGFMSVPTDKTKAPYPVLFEVASAGTGRWTMDMDRGLPDRIRVYFTVHNFDPPETVEELQNIHRTLGAQMIAKYGTGYENYGLAWSREDYYYYDKILGINRAVNWIWSRDDVDRTNFGYVGGSQGGGFGWYLTGLNKHFTSAVLHVPALSDILGFLGGHASGWPRPIEETPADKRDLALRNAPYFDGANFARRTTCPIRVSVGFIDTACNPASVYAAFNVCASKDKAISDGIGMGHFGATAVLDRVNDLWQERIGHQRNKNER